MSEKCGTCGSEYGHDIDCAWAAGVLDARTPLELVDEYRDAIVYRRGAETTAFALSTHAYDREIANAKEREARARDALLAALDKR